MVLTKEQFRKIRESGVSTKEIIERERGGTTSLLSREQFRNLREQGFTLEQIKGFGKKEEEPWYQTGPFYTGIAKPVYKTFKNLPFVKASDIAIEQVAKVIEPKVPAGRTNLELFTKDLPRQVAADFIRGYKPSDAVPFVLGAKAISPVAKPVGKFIWAKIPNRLKKILLKQFTIGKGLPEQYLQAQKQALLEKEAGARAATEAGEVLTIAPQDMTIQTPKGNTITVKKGQPITREHQRYIGRIFRKEIDLGGRQSRLLEDAELTKRINKNVEVEVAFNPKLKGLNQELSDVNKALRNKEILAQGLIGKQFRTGTGFIEEVTGTAKIPRPMAGGEFVPRKPSVGVVTEPISPKPPTVSPIPANLLQGEEQVVRDLSQVVNAPTTNKFQNLTRQELLSKRRQISNKLMKETMKIEEAVRTNYYIFDRRYTEQIRNNPRFKELSEIANKGRDIMDKWSKALIDAGIPKEEAIETIEKNMGEYQARMFEKYLINGGESTVAVSPKVQRMRLNGLKHRKDLSYEILKLMGEIKEPGLPVAIRVKEISSSIANNKIFNLVAENPEWTALTNITGDMIQMPKTPSLGKLSGKFVVKELAEDINAIVSLKTKNKALELYMKGLQAWKFGKVVLNPSTHMRNIMTNTILLDMSGVNHFRQMQLFPKAISEYKNKGPIYQLALETGAIGNEFVGSEVSLVEKFYNYAQGSNLSKWMNVLKTRIINPVGKFYQAEEQIAKMVKFMDGIEKGLTPAVAALESQKWLFNYNEIPNAIKFAKQLAPFITFTYKSLPRVAETLVNNPLKLYKYYALAKAWNESSRKLLDLTPTEYAREEKALPPWLSRAVGGMPTNLLMPLKDKYGRTQWLNLEYILPFGMGSEMLAEGLLKGVVTNPILTLYAQISSNKDFKGSDIVPVGSTQTEAAEIIMQYIYRQLAPSLAPGMWDLKTGEDIFKGGYSFDKIIKAIYKKPDFANRTRDITPVLFDVFMGLKINPVDVAESETFKMIKKNDMIKELNGQAFKIITNPALSQETKDKEIENIFKKIQKVLMEE